jgi:hypothetical protein
VKLSTVIAGTLLLGACSQSAVNPNNGRGRADSDDTWTGDDTWRPIGSNENPNDIVDNASHVLGDVITADDVGKSFGTDDAHIPYPDTYWPFVDQGVDANWNGDSSPLDKYFAVTDPSKAMDGKNWEHANHGKDVPGVAGWWGHCPGWTGAAMTNAPILHPVFAKSDGQGGIVTCNQGDAGCVKFEIGDINALEAEIYVDANSSFIGGRCDTKPSDIKRDANGRILTGGCQGVNPGTLLMVAAGMMKKRQAAFAIDAQNDFNTDQIWNQPAYRYHVYRFQMLSEAQAANYVAYGKPDGDQTHYQWNDASHGWALVDFGIKWVSENGPNTSVVSGANSTRETHMVAVLELDGGDATAQIIGGEYIDDSSVGADRLTVPPFVWVATDAGPEDEPTWAGGNGHNPYVKPSLVKQLIAMGQQQ